MFLLFLLVALIRSPDSKEEIKEDPNLTNQLKKLQIEWDEGSNFTFGDFQNLSKINILVPGISGSGKSTLINYILRLFSTETGTGKPVTKEIINVTKEGIPIEFYDTPGFEIGSNKQKKQFDNIFKYINKRHGTKDPSKFIHCIWYCVNAESKRFQDAEIDFIRKISQDKNLGNIPIIIVLTQCIDSKVKNEMIEVIKQENLNVSAIIPVLAMKKEIDVFGQSITIQPFGLDELINTTTKVVPEILQKTLRALIEHSLKLKSFVSHGIVVSGAGIATFVTAAQIPFVNIFLVIPTNVVMCYSIAMVYGVKLPLNFFITYLRWQFGFLEITNETFSESFKQPEVTYTSNQNNYNSNYNYNYDYDRNYQYFHNYDYYNNHYNYGYQNTTPFTNIDPKLLIPPAGLGGSMYCYNNSPYCAEIASKTEYLAKEIGSMAKEMFEEGLQATSKAISSSINWFKNFHCDPRLSIATGPLTFAVGEGFKGFIEEIYLKKNFKFKDIPVDDIRKHIESVNQKLNATFFRE